MTERGEIEEIPEKVEGLLAALLQSAVLESDARLKVGTPVDTGRLRASWQISKGEGNPSNPIDAGESKTYSDTSPARMIADASTNAVRIVRTGPKANYDVTKKHSLDTVYTITNNMEYAEPICYGTARPASWVASGTTGSSQNPPPWVEGIAKGMQKYIDYNWEKFVKETN